MSLELISIDLSNYCSKACEFCYNKSNPIAKIQWQPEEVISFALNCAENGVKAISLGGGEPFEYEGIFQIVSALVPKLFVSITTNGLPLMDKSVFDKLSNNKPDKIHISIHHPENHDELKRTLFLIRKISKLDIKTGINLLVNANQLENTRKAVQWLYKKGISVNQIIFIPLKGTSTPSTKQIAYVAGTENFQSTFCLTECKRSNRFCSVTFDKKVSVCSYTETKEQLDDSTYLSLTNALNKIRTFKSCML